MKDYIVIDGKPYISSSRAAEMTKYSKDYVGQLCRAGKVDARLMGRSWYVSQESLLDYKKTADEALEARYQQYASHASKATAIAKAKEEEQPVVKADEDRGAPAPIEWKIEPSMFTTPAVPPIKWKFDYSADDRPLMPALSKERAQTFAEESSETIRAIRSRTPKSMPRIRSPFSVSLRSASVLAAAIVIVSFGSACAMHPDTTVKAVARAVESVARVATMAFHPIARESATAPVALAPSPRNAPVAPAPAHMTASSPIDGAGGIANTGAVGYSAPAVPAVANAIPAPAPVLASSNEAAVSDIFTAIGSSVGSFIRDAFVRAPAPQVVETRAEAAASTTDTIQAPRFKYYAYYPYLSGTTTVIHIERTETATNVALLGTTTIVRSYDPAIAARVAALERGFDGLSSAPAVTRAELTKVIGDNISNAFRGYAPTATAVVTSSSGSGSGSVTSVDASGGSTGLSFSGGPITSSGTLTLGGLLSAAYGGTGISSISSGGILLGSYDGASWQQLATSSLGLISTDVAEGSNLYWTDVRFDSRLSATTTLPNLRALAGLTDLISARATTTAATSSDLYVAGTFRGAGLSSCAASGDKLLWDSATGQFTCGADSGAGGGITALRAQYSPYQNGSSQTFATTSDANIVLTITSAGDVHTFAPSWAGVLAAARGGTGISSPAANQLLIGDSAGTGWTQVATSSLGLTTTDVAEGSNQYYTSGRVQTYLDALAKGYFFSTTSTDYYGSQFRDWRVASGALSPTTTIGLLVSASSTIGDGTQAGGLTIAGGATTTRQFNITGVAGVNPFVVSSTTGSSMATLFQNGDFIVPGRIAAGSISGPSARLTGVAAANEAALIVSQQNGSGVTATLNVSTISQLNSASSANTTLSNSLLSVSRASTAFSAKTLVTNNAVATFGDSCTTVSGGICTSTADVVTISQDTTSNSGAALNIYTAGSGPALRVNDDGTFTDTTPFVVDATGNVGIGTTTPYAKLAVSSFNNGSAPLFVVASSTGSGATSTALTIAPNGYVGIGTSTPVANLYVENSVNAGTYMQFINPNTGNSAFASMVVGGSADVNGSAYGEFDYVGSGYAGTGLYQARTSVLAANDTGGLGIGALNSSGKISFYTGSAAAANERMRITSAGDVGIGTTSPYAKLAVDGRGVFNQDVRANYFTSTSTSIASVFPYASTTMVTATTASTTNLVISSAGGTGTRCLQVASDGTVSANASACGSGSGTFSWTPTTFGSTAANSTSTLIRFDAGLASLASSTIGDGTQAGGLVINGGATTTGSAYIAGSLGIGTTTPAWKLSVAGDGSFDGIVRATSFTGTSTAATSTFGVIAASGAAHDGYSISTSKGVYSDTSVSGGMRDGIYNRVFVNGLGVTTGTTTGINNQMTLSSVDVATGEVVGTNNFVYANGSNMPVGAAYGTYNYVTSAISPSSLTRAYGTYTKIAPLTGTIASGYGLYIEPVMATNAWAVYTAGNTKSYFGGSIGIGTTTPYAALAVDGRGVFNQDVRANYFTSTSTSIASVFPYASTTMVTATTASTTNLVISSAGGTGTRCLQVASDGTVSANASACGAGGGGSAGGSWSTTTSQVAGEYVNYSNNNTDVIAIGGNATTTAPFWFDPNALTGFIGGNLGIGTTTPYVKLAVDGRGVFNQDVRANYFTSTSTSIASVFPYASTTMVTATTASTTNLIVSGIASALLKTGADGTVSAAIAGTDYLTASTNIWATSSEDYYASQYKSFKIASGALTPTTTIGLLVSASSTMGDGTQAGGLTIFGGATTTGSAYFQSGATVAGTASLASVQVSGLTGGSTRCLQVRADGTIEANASACAANLSGNLSWSTTTSSVADEYVNYSLGATDIIAVGGSATTTAKFWVDPNTTNMRLGYDGSDYLNTSISSAGEAIMSLVGSTGGLTFSHSAAPSSSLQFAPSATTSFLFLAGGGADSTASGGSAFAGTGGGIALTGGIGGSANGSTATSLAQGGQGGPISISAGQGGATSNSASTVQGGAGGTLSLSGGDGGAGLGGSTNNGGAGGSVYVYGGSGGTGASANGAAGAVYLGTDSSAGHVSSVYLGTASVYDAVNNRLGIGTTSPYAKLAVDGRGVFNKDVRADYFTATSTSATSTLPNVAGTNAAFTGSLIVGTYNGPLQANNGVVTATSSVGVLYGGTGLASAPSYGQLLLGTTAGGYALSATSSLGLLGSSTVSSLGTGYIPKWSGSAFSNSTLYDSGTGVGVATTTTWAPLSIAGNAEIRTATLSIASSTHLSNFSGAGFLAVDQHYAYVTSNSTPGSLAIYDISSSTNPVLLSQVTNSTSLSGAEEPKLVGKYLFIAALSADAISVFDVSNPKNPVNVTYFTDSRLNGIDTLDIVGNYAYVTNTASTPGSESGFTVVDITDPLNLKIVGTLTDSNLNTPLLARVRYPYAYVANEAAAKPYIHVIDISTPTAPKRVATLAIPGATQALTGFDFYGRYLYVNGGANNKMYIVDVSDPTAPAYVNSITVSGTPLTLKVVGDYIFVTQYAGNSLTQYSLASTTNPVPVTTLADAAQLNQPDDIQAQGDHLYLSVHGNGSTIGGGMAIVNVPVFTAPFAKLGAVSADLLTVTHDITANRVVANTSLQANAILSINQVGASNFYAASTTAVSSFLGGLNSTASTTIGNGSWTGGLTVFGSATSTATTTLARSAGVVAIGADPNLSYKLYVNGTTYIDSQLSLNSGLTFLNTSSSIGLRNGNSLISSPADNTFQFGASSNGTLLANKLGIGTTTPNWKLEIADVVPYLALTDTDAGLDKKHLLLSNLDGVFRIGTSSDDLTSTSTAFEIDTNASSAQIGIGTTSPWRTLSVTGSSDLGDDAYAGTFTAASSTATSTFAGFIDVNGTGTNATSTFASNLWVKGGLKVGVNSLYFSADMGTIGIASSSPWGQLSVNPNGIAGPALAIGSSTQTSFIVTNGGQVGIGTPSPNKSLSIQPSIANDGFSIQESDGGNVALLLTADAIAGAIGVNNNNSQVIRLAGRSDTTSYINTGSNFGVGTTSPYATLSVAGRGVFDQDVRADYFTATSSSIASTFTYASTTMVTATTASTTNLVVSGLGGTGTRCLQVSGNGTVSANASACGGAAFSWTTTTFGSTAANSTSTLIRFDAGLASLASTTIGDGTTQGGLTISGNGTTTGDSIVQGMAWLKGAAVGNTGVSTPANIELTVLGNGTGANDSDILLWRNDSVTSAGEALGTLSFGSTDGSRSSGASITAYAAEDYTTNRAGSYLTFKTSNIGANSYSEKMRLTDNGSLGLGTTTPNWALQISSTTPSIALSDTDAPINSQHWFMANYDGVLKIGTSSDALDSTSTAIAITNGNIGIGTSNPTYKFEVMNTSSSGVRIGSPTNTTMLSYTNSGTERTYEYWDVPSVSYSLSSDDNIRFSLDDDLNSTGRSFTILTDKFASELFRVQDDSSVGIASSTPWAQLSINPNGLSGPALAIGSSTGTLVVVTNGGRLGIGTSTPYAKLSVDGRGVFNQDVRADYFTATSTTASSTFAFINVFGTGENATSTFASNVWVQGNLRTTGNSYTGDLFFANNFSFTEAPLDKKLLQGLILKNGDGTPVMTIDEKGNLALTGDVCAKNTSCMSTSVAALQSAMGTLASSTQILIDAAEASTTLTMRGLASSIDGLYGSLSALSGRIDSLAAAAGQAMTLSSSTLADVASSTASTLAGSQSFIGAIAQAVQDTIAAAGNWVVDRMSAHIAYIDRVEAKTVAVSQGLEMKDQLTGDVYCVMIRNGDWSKAKGTCADFASSTQQTAPQQAVTTTTQTNTAPASTAGGTTTPTTASTAPAGSTTSQTTTASSSSASGTISGTVTDTTSTSTSASTSASTTPASAPATTASSTVTTASSTTTTTMATTSTATTVTAPTTTAASSASTTPSTSTAAPAAAPTATTSAAPAGSADATASSGTASTGQTTAQPAPTTTTAATGSTDAAPAPSSGTTAPAPAPAPDTAPTTASDSTSSTAPAAP